MAEYPFVLSLLLVSKSHISHCFCIHSFSISAVQLCNLDRAAATEFLDVYQSVLPEFNSMIDEFTKGPCYVMELTGTNDSTSFTRATIREALMRRQSACRFSVV